MLGMSRVTDPLMKTRQKRMKEVNLKVSGASGSHTHMTVYKASMQQRLLLRKAITLVLLMVGIYCNVSV